MARVRYLRRLDQVEQLTANEQAELKPVSDQFAFRANDYYLSLIDWNNPDDPIRKIIIPHPDELYAFGDMDASREKNNCVVPGCQHEYPHTVLLMCNEICGGYCRFCFRKRLFMDNGEEVVNDLTAALDYIRDNKQITNVLLTGGDPLLLSTRRLEKIIGTLREFDHVRILRLGTKMTAFNPHRILDDPELPRMLARFNQKDRKIYVMNHFNVPGELTDKAIAALDMLIRAGVIMVNQTPILRGINDNAATLAELMRKLSFVGVPAYYFFQCRPTAGNKPFVVPLVSTYHLFEEAKKQVSGLAKRARLVMSHQQGKMEIVGINDETIFLRYHRARYPGDEGRLMAFKRNDQAFWLEDLVPIRLAPRHDPRPGDSYSLPTGADG